MIFGVGSVCDSNCRAGLVAQFVRLFQCFLTSVFLPRRDSDLLAPDREVWQACPLFADCAKKFVMQLLEQELLCFSIFLLYRRDPWRSYAQ